MKLLLFTLFVCTAADNLRSATVYEYIPCVSKDFECVCPGTCLINSTKGCYPKDCWKYDNTNGCAKSGKKWLPAMILQAIPVTGVFGSGFGNLGKWDIFGVYMAVVFGPFCLFCCIICYTLSKEVDEDDEKTDCTGCLVSILTCVWSTAMTVMWIWGIVVIANNEMKVPWTNFYGNEIQCFPVN